MGGGAVTTLTAADAAGDSRRGDGGRGGVAGIEHAPAARGQRSSNWQTQVQGVGAAAARRCAPGRWRSGVFFDASSGDARRQGGRARRRWSATSCSASTLDPGRADRAHRQPAVPRGRRDEPQGAVGHGPGPGRRGVRALHDGAEADPGRAARRRTSRCWSTDGSSVVGGVGGHRRRRSAVATRWDHRTTTTSRSRTPEEMATVLTQTTDTMTYLLASVAAGLAAGRRHRHHEHHAGVGDRADQGDRPAARAGRTASATCWGSSSSKRWRSAWPGGTAGVGVGLGGAWAVSQSC